MNVVAAAMLFLHRSGYASAEATTAETEMKEQSATAKLITDLVIFSRVQTRIFPEPTLTISWRKEHPPTMRSRNFSQSPYGDGYR